MDKEKVADLSREEQLALVALVEHLALADAETDAEADGVAALAAELGGEVYRELAGEADDRFPDEDALKAFLSGITSPDARELIFGRVLGEAEKGSVVPQEDFWLSWLASEWKITLAPADGEDLAGEGEDRPA